MSLSKRCEYALRALACLAEAQASGAGPLLVREIASRQNLPGGFLNQILLQLREAGLVVTRRGKRGGTFLGKPADGIRLGDVIRLIDGPMAPVRCVSKTAYERCSCPDEASCGLRLTMLKARDALLSVLETETVATLVPARPAPVGRGKAAKQGAGPSCDGNVTQPLLSSSGGKRV